MRFTATIKLIDACWGFVKVLFVVAYLFCFVGYDLGVGLFCWVLLNYYVLSICFVTLVLL